MFTLQWTQAMNTKKTTRSGFLHSFRFKLGVMSGVSAFVGIALVASLFAWRSYQAERTNLETSLTSAASVYVAAMSKPVSAGNKTEALNMLKGIRQISAITQADIRLTDGTPFIQIGSGATLIGDHLSQHRLLTTRGDTIRLETNIVRGGQEIATLGMLADVSGLKAQLRDNLIVIFLVSLGAFFLSFLLSQVTLIWLTRPLVKLTSAVQTIGKSQDFTHSLPAPTRDETGTLTQAFSEMMAGIRKRDAQLADYVNNLEELVDARTAELKHARDAAEAANEAKTEFLATVSHEVRTPMNGMLVMSELLANADLSQQNKRYAEIIHRSGTGLLTIINDLLDITKIENGQIELEEIAFSPDALVDNTVSIFLEKAREKSLELTTFIGPDVPGALMGDPTRFGQILSNLVNNALKFTERGGVDVSLTVKHGLLQLLVTDTGIGIDEAKIDKIFERYTQAERSTTRKYGGTGLGLSVCQSLAEAMGGRIEVTSELGKGSRFCVTIPLTTAEPAPHVSPVDCTFTVQSEQSMLRDSVTAQISSLGGDTRGAEKNTKILVATSKVLTELDEGMLSTYDRVVCIAEIGDAGVDALLRAGHVHHVMSRPVGRTAIVGLFRRISDQDWSSVEEPAERISEGERSQLDGVTVLAADDSPINREILRETLSTLDVAVDFAEDGIAAVWMAQGGDYDAIFMDGQMPRMDGYEATKKIRLFDQHVPIIELSAMGRKAGEEGWRECGMTASTPKPFSIESISAALLDALSPSDPLNRSDTDTSDNSASDILDEETIRQLAHTGEKSGRDLVRIVWNMFETKAPEAIEEIAKHAGDDQFHKTSKAAHALKSMCLNSGATKLANLAGDIEQTPGCCDAEMIASLQNAHAESLRAFNATWSGLSMPVSKLS